MDFCIFSSVSNNIMSTSKSSSAALSWRDRGLICLAGVQALQSVAAATKAVMRAMVAGER
jgi:hypothetical protein